MMSVRKLSCSGTIIPNLMMCLSTVLFNTSVYLVASTDSTLLFLSLLNLTNPFPSKLSKL